MYVCTEKAAIQEWLKEIEELKKELELEKDKNNKLNNDNDGLVKENLSLIKKVKLLEQDRDVYRKKYNKLLESMSRF
jgi:septal ring factor EnvC (AmiA/AmiB activator)